MIVLDTDCPKVVRIEVVGKVFNKKPRAIIRWNDKTINRKMADFKWFWKMLSLNSSMDCMVPDYPSNATKKELNRFLKKCHSMQWIQQGELYKNVFFETDKKQWKKKRDSFERQMMDRGNFTMSL